MDLIKTGKLIAKKRKEKKLTQKELADLLNVNEKTVSKWERGINTPDISILLSLSEALDLSVIHILSGTDMSYVDDLNCKITDEDNVVIESVKFYNKKLKYKFVFFILFSVLSVLFLFLMLFTFNNYNKIQIYNVNGSSESFSVGGNFVHNNQSDLIILRPIVYNESHGDIEINYISVSLMVGDKILYNESKEYEQFIMLTEVIDDFYIYVEDNFDANIVMFEDNEKMYDMKLEIIYYDFNDYKYQEILNLNFVKKFSNNKLFY